MKILIISEDGDEFKSIMPILASIRDIKPKINIYLGSDKELKSNLEEINKRLNGESQDFVPKIFSLSKTST